MLLLSFLLAILFQPVFSGGGSFVMEPGYQLPAWLDIGFTLNGVPEVGKQVSVEVNLTSLVADLPGCEVRLRFPSGVKLISGPALWSCTLEKGKTTRFSSLIVCEAPQAGAIAVMSVKTTYPVRKLKTIVLREHGADDPEARELIRQLNQLKGRYPVVRTLDLFVTEHEGFSGSSEPAFGLYLKNRKVPGKRGFVIKNSLFKGRSDKAQAQVESFRRFLTILAQRPKVAEKVIRSGGSLESQLSEHVERLLFLGNRYLLEGKAGKASDIFKEAISLEADEVRKVASSNALAVAFYQYGQKKKAGQIWKDLLAKYDESPLMRYVDYNLGIKYLLDGNSQRALIYLRNAFIRKPEYTHVKKLLAELE